MIEIINLTKVYKKGTNEVTALKDVNVHIKKGSIHGIIGLSGAGKSSLIRCINRIEDPSGGSIKVNGINILQLNQRDLRNLRKKIGMIFQGFNLLSSKTVFENVAFPLELSNFPKDEIEKKVISLLKLVGLEDKKHVYPSMLSGGQKQRVGIARALANDPDVLLCDEATSALDPKTTKQILDLLKDINKRLGLTMVVVTHEMEVIKEICDFVTILEGGRVIEEGSTIDVFSKPRMNITKDFVGVEHNIPKNLLDGKVLYLSFTDGSAGSPIISKIIKKFDVEVNILSGHIEYIDEKPIGKLSIKIDTNHNRLQDIIDYLEKNHVKTEVIVNERDTRTT